jgi:hypothetical protein
MSNKVFLDIGSTRARALLVNKDATQYHEIEACVTRAKSSANTSLMFNVNGQSFVVGSEAALESQYSRIKCDPAQLVAGPALILAYHLLSLLDLKSLDVLGIAVHADFPQHLYVKLQRSYAEVAKAHALEPRVVPIMQVTAAVMSPATWSIPSNETYAVVVAGHRTVEVATIDRGSYNRDRSGRNRLAGETLIRNIAQELPGESTVIAELEHQVMAAIQHGDGIPFRGERFTISADHPCVREWALLVWDDLRKTIKRFDDLHTIVLCGGTAPWLAANVLPMLEGRNVMVAPDPATAVVHGMPHVAVSYQQGA